MSQIFPSFYDSRYPSLEIRIRHRTSHGRPFHLIGKNLIARHIDNIIQFAHILLHVCKSDFFQVSRYHSIIHADSELLVLRKIPALRASFASACHLHYGIIWSSHIFPQNIILIKKIFPKEIWYIKRRPYNRVPSHYLQFRIIERKLF